MFDFSSGHYSQNGSFILSKMAKNKEYDVSKSPYMRSVLQKNKSITQADNPETSSSKIYDYYYNTSYYQKNFFNLLSQKDGIEINENIVLTLQKCLPYASEKKQFSLSEIKLKLYYAIKEKQFQTIFSKNKNVLNLIKQGLNILPPFSKKASLLQELDISDNKLMMLPNSLGKLKLLQILKINNNILEILPESIGDLTSLQTLGLDNNILEILPESIGNLTSLQILKLNSNKLKELPNSFSDLTSLQRLDIYNNRLGKLPNSLGKLKLLQTLNLSHNIIKILPESIGNLTSLQTLELSHNIIKILPNNIGNLKSLQELWLHGNKLKTLPESFGDLESLKGLLIHSNELISLPDSFKNLKSLVNLDISNMATLNTEIGRQSLFDFFDNVPETLRNLTVEGTLTWEQIPEHIQNNHEIYIDVRPRHLRLQNINAAQSTHTQSVHFFSSLYAAKLQQKFPDINVGQALVQLEKYVKNLPTKNPKIENGYPNQAFINATAQRFMNNIPHADTKDETSGIDIQTFLALFWNAANDDNLRSENVTRQDALKAITQSLYEIKRGYNINEKNKDNNNKDDSTICYGGTFNKIYEKSCGIIKDAKMIFLTKETIEKPMFQPFNDTEKQEKNMMGFYRHVTDRVKETIKTIPDILDEDGYLKENNSQILENVVKIVAELLPKAETLKVDAQEELTGLPENLKGKFEIAIKNLNETIQSWTPSSEPNGKLIEDIMKYLKLYDFSSDESQIEIGQSSATKHDEIEEVHS